MSDAFDLLENELDKAEKAFQKVSFGKLTISVDFLKWNNPGSSEPPVTVTQDEYANLDPQHRSFRYNFSVNVQEFAPHLTFNYERQLTPGTADWNKSFAPSVEAVTSAGSMKKENAGSTLRGINGRYVEITDVPQQPRKNNKHLNPNTGEPYTTLTITKVYDSREACYADYVARFGDKSNGNGNGSGETPKTDSAPKVSGGLKTWDATAWREQWGDMLGLYLDPAKPQSVRDLAGMYGEDEPTVEAALVMQYWNTHADQKTPQIATALKMPVVKVNGIMQNGIHPAF